MRTFGRCSAVTPTRSRRRDERRIERQIEVQPTEDVLSLLATQRRPDQVVVGFAAEHGSGAVAYGREKLARKGLDAIVVNDISRADIGTTRTRTRL